MPQMIFSKLWNGKVSKENELHFESLSFKKSLLCYKMCHYIYFTTQYDLQHAKPVKWKGIKKMSPCICLRLCRRLYKSSKWL